jgi:signal peptidase II
MEATESRGAKTPILLLTLLAVITLDVATKRWALDALAEGSIELLNGTLPLTLAFNTGAAFSLHLGDASRYIFTALSIGALCVLVPLYRATPARARWRLLSIALVAAGAIGNLIDRVRWDRGVVDFIGPVDLGFMRWPIFNVADMAITTGAIVLALSLMREESSELPPVPMRATDDPGA